MREPHRVRSLRGRHDEGAVIAQMLGYVGWKPKQIRRLRFLQISYLKREVALATLLAVPSCALLSRAPAA